MMVKNIIFVLFLLIDTIGHSQSVARFLYYQNNSNWYNIDSAQSLLEQELDGENYSLIIFSYQSKPKVFKMNDEAINYLMTDFQSQKSSRSDYYKELDSLILQFPSNRFKGEINFVYVINSTEIGEKAIKELKKFDNEFIRKSLISLGLLKGEKINNDFKVKVRVITPFKLKDKNFLQNKNCFSLFGLDNFQLIIES